MVGKNRLICISSIAEIDKHTINEFNLIAS